MAIDLHLDANEAVAAPEGLDEILAGSAGDLYRYPSAADLEARLADQHQAKGIQNMPVSPRKITLNVIECREGEGSCEPPETDEAAKKGQKDKDDDKEGALARPKAKIPAMIALRRMPMNGRA